jgi:hypothetical protein
MYTHYVEQGNTNFNLHRDTSTEKLVDHNFCISLSAPWKKFIHLTPGHLFSPSCKLNSKT